MGVRPILDYESRHQPVLSRGAFAWRVASSTGIALLLVGVSLAAGMVGYHHYENMAWIDAFVNASMILSGMGPLTPLKNWGGKMFAGLYALYSGLTVIVAAGLILAPVVHRVLHRFHVESDGG